MRLTRKRGDACERPKYPRVFLDIPYKKTYQNIEDVIRAILRTYRLHPVAAKDRNKTSYLLNEIKDLIKSCQYAIVDFTGLNFNVGFEAGLLEAWGCPYILLKHRNTKSPSDLQGIRYSEYSNPDNLSKHLIQWIKQNVKEAKPIRETELLTEVIKQIMANSQVDLGTATAMVKSMLSTLGKSADSLPPTGPRAKRKR
jgi:predicted nucleotide-binding protein